jgi:DNA-binding MarR family transcriptional regulator
MLNHHLARGVRGPAGENDLAFEQRLEHESVNPDGEVDGVRLGPLEGFIGYNLRLAQSVSFRVFARSVGQRGLRAGHFAALMVIERNPGISQIALGRAIARDKSTVTPLICSMQKRRLVQRRRSKTDRRSITLWLTAAGAAMLAQLIAHAAEHDRKLDEIVGERKPEFLELLRRIADRLT